MRLVLARRYDVSGGGAFASFVEQYDGDVVASGSTTVPTGATSVLIEVWGGGCGGGHLNLSVGLGGPAGGYCSRSVTVSGDTGETITWQAGQGGPGRISGNGAGSSGTVSAVVGATLSTAVSMVADPGTPSGGGGASGGTTNHSGGTGSYPTGGSAQNGASLGGQELGDNGLGPGGGGAGGGLDFDSGSDRPGGNGKAGRVRFSWT